MGPAGACRMVSRTPGLYMLDVRPSVTTTNVPGPCHMSPGVGEGGRSATVGSLWATRLAMGAEEVGACGCNSQAAVGL